MTPLNWQESPQKGSGNSSRSSAPSSASNPWFAISIGLLGLIVGFGIGKWRVISFPATTGTPPAQVAQAPTAPTPQQPPEPTSTDNLPAIDAKTDHIRGDLGKATVAVVEYSDFECPYCKRHHPTMQQIMQTYGDKVVWVYRHFPLSFHPNAKPAAIASECANELGGSAAFWKFIDAVFDSSSFDFIALAKQIGLDEKKFATCVGGGAYEKHIQQDMDGGQKAGVNGTPGNIVVNLKTDENRIVSGAQPLANFTKIIDQFLQQ